MAQIDTVVVLTLNHAEAVALGRITGSLSVLNMLGYGLTEEQARMVQAIYSDLADQIVVFEPEA